MSDSYVIGIAVGIAFGIMFVALVSYYLKKRGKQNNQTTTSNFPCNFNFTVSNMNRFNQGIDHG